MRGIFLIDFTFFILFSTMAAAVHSPPSYHPHTIVQPSHTNTILLIVAADAATNIRDLRRSSNDHCLLKLTDLPPQNRSASGEGELVACENLSRENTVREWSSVIRTELAGEFSRLVSVREQENY